MGCWSVFKGGVGGGVCSGVVRLFGQIFEYAFISGCWFCLDGYEFVGCVKELQFYVGYLF